MTFTAPRANRRLAAERVARRRLFRTRRMPNRPRGAVNSARGKVGRSRFANAAAAARHQLSRVVMFFRMRQVRLALVVIATLAVGLGLNQYMRTSPAFALRTIDVEGGRLLNEHEILRIARLRVGANIFRVDCTEIEERLLRHPWIAHVRVRRELPGRLRIIVDEHEPIALLSLDELYLVSERGKVFKRLETGDPADLPIITGVRRERFLSDRAYRTQFVDEALVVLRSYDAAGLANAQPISEVNFHGVHGVGITIGDVATYVHLGAPPYAHKLKRLGEVFGILNARGQQPRYIFLESGKQPNQVTVGLRKSN